MCTLEPIQCVNTIMRMIMYLVPSDQALERACIEPYRQCLPHGRYHTWLHCNLSLKIHQVNESLTGLFQACSWCCLPPFQMHHSMCLTPCLPLSLLRLATVNSDFKVYPDEYDKITTVERPWKNIHVFLFFLFELPSQIATVTRYSFDSRAQWVW
jgi:hypothetical protein